MTQLPSHSNEAEEDADGGAPEPGCHCAPRWSREPGRALRGEDGCWRGASREPRSGRPAGPQPAPPFVPGDCGSPEGKRTGPGVNEDGWRRRVRSTRNPHDRPRTATPAGRAPTPSRVTRDAQAPGPPRLRAACERRLVGERGANDRGRSFQTERLLAEQIKEYKGVFEMFDEEGNGEVKTGELERLMSLLGINPTKSELTSMAKDVDRDNKGFFNCDGFLALMGVYHEKAQNQESELRAAFRVFDKEGKGYIDWNTLKPHRYVLMNAGEPLNEVEAEQMMKEADKDGDGTIDYEEFVAMMTGESFKLIQ
ncbi:calmodulin-like protein 6 isoform X3 [Macaca mulatta]